ncbi:hypothetical protein [Sporosarcina sp. E16_8]|uniref:hypothetical protein n=1 Tax=Sporosarcina sp. E16_8 TaxID=2789295 RepID=UPI001A910B29|nr:hypothetical protein [Sporosarcina sp. E16_8]MBO0586450.1 hypothetical protein [Sporosarcina sp. E16_8]
MNYFHSELKAGEMVKVPLSSSIATISNMGDNELSVNFDSEEPGLIIPKKMGRTFNLNGYVEYLYLLSTLGTTVQVDAFAGGYFMTSPAVSVEGGGVPEVPGGGDPVIVKFKASPYFPLPIPGEFDSWTISHEGEYILTFYNGLLTQEESGQQYVSDEISYMDRRTSGYDFEYSPDWGSDDQPVQFYPNRIIIANSHVINEFGGSPLYQPSIFGTWEDNKGRLDFYPKRYLSIPPRAYDTWIITREGEDIFLYFHNGNTLYIESNNMIVQAGSGYKKYSWTEDGGYIEVEDVSDSSFRVESIALSDILESHKDILDGSQNFLRQRTLLRVINPNELETGGE